MRETGLEPAQLAPPAPQAGVSTNSTTPAGELPNNATDVILSKTDMSVNPVCVKHIRQLPKTEASEVVVYF